MSSPTASSLVPDDILERIASLSREGASFAMMLLLRTEGSTPCSPGARAVVTKDGRCFGTVGGGQLEAESQRRACQALQTRLPQVFDFELQGETCTGSEPLCGGRARVLIDPTAADHLEAYALALGARKGSRPGLLLTRIRHTPTPQVTVQFAAHGEPAVFEEPPDDATIRRVLQCEEPVLLESFSAPGPQGEELLVEPIVPRPRLVVVGGGHVGQAVALQAGLVEFDILVIDDRPEYTRPELFPPGTTTRCGDIADELKQIRIDAQTYIVIVTRGHHHDATALEVCLRRPAAYVGMIGSRRKVAMIRRDFLESGRATAEALDHVHAPVGLDIGALTVREIAVSIVAELIAVRRGAAWGETRIQP